MNRGYYYRQPSFGGALQAISPGVKFLLISNAVVFVMQMVFGDGFTQLFGVIPIKVLKDLAFYQIITYMFLHGGFFHIFFNMLILWMIGNTIENDWGTKKFLKYYFLCGIAGGVFTVMFMPNSPVPTIGASGAIYGLLVAYAVMYPNNTIYIFFVLPMKVKWAVIIFVGIAFVASFNAQSSSIGHLAHLGGAVVGFLYLKLDWRFRKLLHTLSPLRFFRDRRYRKNVKKMEKNREKTEEIMKRVDEILDKINEVGIENISEEDRRFLGSASDILSKKDK
ncbi:MAG: rhomboid family intramembrane serine protease [Candidatus Zixiibacteriota bacterium]